MTTIDHSPQPCFHCHKLIRDYRQWHDEYCLGTWSTMHAIKDVFLLPIVAPEPEPEETTFCGGNTYPQETRTEYIEMDT